MEKLKLFLSAMFSGICVGIGCIVFLSVDIKIAGALLFTFGLYAIVIFKFALYTGRVGYLPDNKPKYLLDLLVIWLGNYAGTVLLSVLINLSRINGISETAKTLCDTKMNDSFLSLFILGIFCGMLMFVAVDGYAKTKNPVILFLCIGGFILCGFEHCVADMFYFSIAKMFNLQVLLRLLTITLGNSVGGVLIKLFEKIPEKKKAV